MRLKQDDGVQKFGCGAFVCELQLYYLRCSLRANYWHDGTLTHY